MKYINLKTFALMLSASGLIAMTGCGSSGTPTDYQFVSSPVPPSGENVAPVANAGEDQTVKQCTKITVDGSKSYDEDGQIVSYVWFAPDGQKLGEGAILEYTMSLPVPPGDYIITLVVTDDEGATASDTVTITFEDYKLSVTNKGVVYADFNGSNIKDMEFSSDGSKLYAAVSTGGTTGGGNSVEKGLTILDFETNTTEHIDTGYYGRYVKLSKDEKTAYVSGGGDDWFSFIDMETKTVRKQIDLNDYHSGIAITADGTKAYVGWESEGIAILDLQAENNVSRLILNDNGNYANTVILSKDEKTLFVTESMEGFVIYDLINNTFDTVVTSGSNQYAADFALSSDEKTAYVTLGVDGGVDIIDIDGKSISDTVLDINGTDQFSMTRQVKVSWDDKLLFVADKDYDDMLFVIDLEDNYKVSSVKNTSGTQCKGPESVEISVDGSKVLLGCRNGVIVEFDISCQ